MNPGSYLPSWNETFNPFDPLALPAPAMAQPPSVETRFRQAQSKALRVWCAATAREWRQHAAAVRDSVNEWAAHVPIEVRQAQLQDMLARALNAEGAVAALPLLLDLGASLLEPHPSLVLKHHPMHVALQPSHCNGKVIGAVLACLPKSPFANGADPFPGWPRDHALETLFEHQFGQKAWERARTLGLDPSPAEQAVLMSTWLRLKQRKRCSIALQEWGWTPEPTALLMDSWWSGHAWDKDEPNRLHGFDRQWLERFSERLTFSPAIREMTEVTLPPVERTRYYDLVHTMGKVACSFTRITQWLILVPPSDHERTVVHEAFTTLVERVNDWQARCNSVPSNAIEHQKLEATVLGLEMEQQAIQARLNGDDADLLNRVRARL